MLFPQKLIDTLNKLNKSDRFVAGKYVNVRNPHFISGSAFVISAKAAAEVVYAVRCLPDLYYIDDLLISILRELLIMDIFALNFESSCGSWLEAQQLSLEFVNRFVIIHRVPSFSYLQQYAIYDLLEHQKVVKLEKGICKD